jgi:hypothetical protein
MLHAICTHGNRVASQLLVVSGQIANLTPDPSFGHNLCFRCSNGRYEPSLNIYIPKSFHWYKKLFKPLSFDPYNRPLKIWESIETSTPKVELPWGVKVHSLTLSHIPGSMLCDFRLPSSPTTLQTLVHKKKMQKREGIFFQASAKPSHFWLPLLPFCFKCFFITSFSFQAKEKKRNHREE